MPMETWNQKFSFEYIAFEEQPKVSLYRRCGKNEKKRLIFSSFFASTAAGGAIYYFWFQTVNTLIEISSCGDRRSIST